MKHLPFALIFLLQILGGIPTEPGGIATGQVRLADGSPAAGIDVFFVPAPGSTPAPPINYAVADPNGRYRVDTLTPGTYYISAARNDAEFPTYYPGEPAFATARTITAELGKTVTADFSLVKPSGVSVSGVLKGMPAAATGDEVQVLMRRSDISGPFPKVSVKTDGAFAFANVPPGDYLLRVAPGSPCRGAISINMPIRISNADVNNIEITAAPFIEGRMVVEDGTALPANLDDGKALPPGINFKRALAGVQAQRNGGGCSQGPGDSPIGTVRPNGLFVGSLIVGEYKIVPSVPLGYTVKSMTAGGVDLLQLPFKVSQDIPSPEIRIVLMPPSSGVTLSGHLTGVSAGQTGGATSVALIRIPESGPNTQGAEAPLHADGTFEFHNVVPGNYWMHAKPTVMPQANPASLSGDLSLTVGTQDILGIDLPRSIPCNCVF